MIIWWVDLAKRLYKKILSYSWRFNIEAIKKNVEDISSFPEIHNSIYEGPVLFIGGGKSDHIQ